MADAELLRLSRLFDVALAAEAAVESDDAYDNAWRATQRVVRRIERASATTLAGLIIKARAAAWGGELQEGAPLTASIFRDLLAA